MQSKLNLWDLEQANKRIYDQMESDARGVTRGSAVWNHQNVTYTANAVGGTRGFADELFLSNRERFVSGKTPLDIALGG